MAKDSITHVYKVLLFICLVCSFFVSFTTVMLKDRQEDNQRLARIEHILNAAGLPTEGENVQQVFKERVKPLIIELDNGEELSDERFNGKLNIGGYNFTDLANDPVYGESIAPENDIAKLKRRPRYMLVYSVKTRGHIEKLILPVYGKGLWSTLQGFLALNKDLQTIAGITFYQHGETPGLGGEVDNPKWKQKWKGKLAFDDHGRVAIHVLRGAVDPQSSKAPYQIDGIAGATLTSRGVDKLVNYWLGANGYGPFLARLRQEWHMNRR